MLFFQIVSTAAIILAAFYAGRQLRESVRVSKMEEARIMIEALATDEQTQLRKNVYGFATNTATKYFNSKSTGKREYFTVAEVDEAIQAYYSTLPIAKHKKHFNDFLPVIRTLDRIGLLVNNNMMEPSIFYEPYCDALIRCWTVFGPIINKERELRGEMGKTPHTFVHLENLAKDAVKFHREHFSNNTIQIYIPQEK